MPERDYAAPLKHERRESIFAKLRPSSIWGREPTGLQYSPARADEVPLVPPIPDALRSEHVTEAVEYPQHSRSGSIPKHSPRSNQERTKCTTQRVGKTAQVAATGQVPPVRSTDPVWLAGSHGHSEVVPSPSPSASSPAPAYQHHLNAGYLRDDSGHLFFVPDTPHLGSLEQTIRRQQKQPSLRPQVSQNNNNRTQVSSVTAGSHTAAGRSAVVQSSVLDPVPGSHHKRNWEGSISNGIARAIVTSERNVGTGSSSYSYHPEYSPRASAIPHAFPQLSRHSSAARTLYSRGQVQHVAARISNLNSDRNSRQPANAELRDNSASTPLSPKEIQVSFQHDPTSSSHTPLQTQPNDPVLINRRAVLSNTSIATFDNPGCTSPPLSRRGANLVGLANMISFKHKRHKSKTVRLWKARLVKFTRKAKDNIRLLLDPDSHERKTLRCKIDVFWTGPLRGCKCKICLKSIGPPCDYKKDKLREYHEVPKCGWLNISPAEYDKLNWPREEDPRATNPPVVSYRGLGEFRLRQNYIV